MVMVPHVSSTFMLKWLIQQNNSCHAHTACTISDSRKKSTLPSCANEKSISRKYTSCDALTISNWHRRFVAIIIIQSRYFPEIHHYRTFGSYIKSSVCTHFVEIYLNFTSANKWVWKNYDGKQKSRQIIFQQQVEIMSFNLCTRAYRVFGWMLLVMLNTESRAQFYYWQSIIVILISRKHILRLSPKQSVAYSISSNHIQIIDWKRAHCYGNARALHT